MFEALGHETRLKVFDLIYRSGKAGVRPKDMIDSFGFDSGTLDFHLKKLVAVKLISLKKEGRRGIYCASEHIPYELLQLFEAVDTGKGLLVRDPTSLIPSNRELLH
jgi:DNA-binding transcriptional ArsR family regulator